jgi:NADH:ubiquinone oxidoreductase subunit F (NADH-binding)
MTLLPRLLSGVADGDVADLRSHLEVDGTLPDLRRRPPAQLIDEIERSGLRGRGGASFPVAKKLQAVSARRRAKVVVGNGTEGEPASGKDRLLLATRPHLVLDGAAVAARAVGAGEAIIAFSAGDDAVAAGLAEAVEERRAARLSDGVRFELFAVDDGFVAGNESALVNAINGGEAKPTFGPRPFQSGVRRRPTLVQNVETLAHLGLIARHGAEWFRETGTNLDPGSTLVTLSGAVTIPGVYEIEHGALLTDLLDHAGLTDDLTAVLIGGYFGSWLPANLIGRVRLSPRALSEHGASLGAGVIVALGGSACPVAETSRIADYFTAESAGQCGPCVNGLGAIAETMAQVARGTAATTAKSDLARWSSSLAGRGACQFPDGATRFVASALRVFARDFDDHRRHGPCERCSAQAVLPTPMAMAMAY